eukprot:7199241-Alexandrium_andersonii.AAC.1
MAKWTRADHMGLPRRASDLPAEDHLNAVAGVPGWLAVGRRGCRAWLPNGQMTVGRRGCHT